ncbi:hypothetical protein PHYPSEUDO_008768 [Phytophthora pseudosyringae]|uniref:Crinkler (CRN) family protein n=1 Tax=Phytophthora pseudosyringae TaxID=221518 RepID=A0A8T1VDG6_9STRA|nr:hypothetical protein PHYPSEUDO_008768 [Phytophthora pseudosyringae]
MTGVHAPSSKQVHVLVVLPSDKKRKRDAAVDGETAQDKKTINFDEFLENCPEKGSLPTEGDFLQLFEWNYQNCGEVKDIEAIGNIVGFTGSKFFVRKEVVCVLENLKIFKGIFDSGVFSKQFVLLGSPGTGKSCVLALLCFYVAVTTDQPVLWFRTVSGGRGERATRLFYKKKYYQWDGDDGEIYDCVYDEIKSRTKGFFWPCLDGFNQESLSSSHSRRVVDFTLLATSGQFDVKSEGFSLVTLCLMPYWNRADLKLLARAFEEPTEEDIANRYFASGGCLREFLNPDAREILQFALDKITTPEHARSLLTARGCTSNEQIDRLRMRGVADVSNPTYYVKPSKWKAVVNSLFVLRHLTSLMEPNFFEELIGLARGMKDDRLEGVALEGYFHALVRRGQPISIDYCTYDNVDRTIMNKKEWRTIMDKDKGSISCAPANKVKWSGDSIEHCVRIMEEWAVDLSIADYWIPADSLCETIDAVAKCKFPGEKDSRICFLQLTKAQKHKCDADILWRLAQPFVGNAKVCYIALLSLPDKEIRSDFRLKPAVISNPEVLEHIPLYVASYRLGSIESTSS